MTKYNRALCIVLIGALERVALKSKKNKNSEKIKANMWCQFFISIKLQNIYLLCIMTSYSKLSRIIF